MNLVSLRLNRFFTSVKPPIWAWSTDIRVDNVEEALPPLHRCTSKIKSYARLGRRTHCQVMRDGKILAAGGSAFVNTRAMCLRRRIVQPMPLKV